MRSGGGIMESMEFTIGLRVGLGDGARSYG